MWIRTREGKTELRALRGRVLGLEGNTDFDLFPGTEDSDIIEINVMIYFYSEKIKNTFNRQQVLEFIEKQFGPEVAHAVDINCTKKKRMAKRLHVKPWKKKK